VTAWTLLILLTAHFVADFLAQSDKMGTLKSKSWKWLAIHVFVYTAIVGAVATVWMIAPSLDVALNRSIWFITLTFVTHFVTDAITSRITTKLWFFKRHEGEYVQWSLKSGSFQSVVNPWTYEGGNRHWFFVAIGFDQLVHVWTLALTWMWVMR